MPRLPPQLPAPNPPAVRRSLGFRLLRFGRRQAAAGAAALAAARVDRRDMRLAKLRALALADPAAALARVVRARRIRPGDRFLAEAEALLAVRVHGWAAAAPRFARLPDRGPDQAAVPDAAAVLRRETPPGLELVLPAPGRPAALPAAAARIVVYTARFGPGAPPAPQQQRIPGLRWLLLTDRELAVPGWETRRMPAPDPDPARAMLRARIDGPALLADPAEASLWLDPGLQPVGNLHTLLTRWLTPADPLVLWRHPRAQSWREIVEDALLGGAEPAPLLALAGAGEAAGLGTGIACDTRAIWRRHDDPAVAALMAAWAARATPATADAAFAALLAEPAAPLRPRILPASLGTAEDGAFLAAAPWAQPVLAPSRARPPAGLLLPVAFLYAEEFAAAASTFLRMGQLKDLVAEHLPDRYDIAWTSDFEATRDSVVLLVKGALQTRAPEELARLRARNIAVVGSWDDLKTDPGRVAALDANMAVSHRQMLDLARRYPGTASFYVPHHVNRLIRPAPPPMDRLRTGYFGELADTVRPDSLSGMIELVGIDTSRNESGWIARLPEFNCHWIVRRRRKIDGAKPFLKGFLAARCGAVVVVGRDDEDALLYLGDDYPFFVRSLEAGDLEADMVRIAAGFGGPDWQLARAIMAQVAARSTDAVVAEAFAAMLQAVTA